MSLTFFLTYLNIFNIFESMNLNKVMICKYCRQEMHSDDNATYFCHYCGAAYLKFKDEWFPPPIKIQCEICKNYYLDNETNSSYYTDSFNDIMLICNNCKSKNY
jgi:Zn finger protein HypA/HybF involved in hydrogenase expression